MVDEGVQESGKPRRLPAFLRSESSAETVGLALTVIVICAMAGSAWWTVRNQRQSLRDAQVEQMQAVGNVIAGSAEAMLTTNEISSLRRLIVDASQNHQLMTCQVALVDGSVIADANPSAINLMQPQASWPKAAVPEEKTQTIFDDQMTLSYTLSIQGRGTALLRMSKQLKASAGSSGNSLTGLGAIGAVALLALLLVYRQTRSRMRAMGAIREALLAMQHGEGLRPSLAINDELGQEATAWNHILAQAESLRKQTLKERAHESLVDRRQNKVNLEDAFDAMTQGVILLDPDMNVTYANGASAALLQHSREKIAESNILELVRNEQVCDLLERWSQGSRRQRGIVEAERGEDESTGILRWSIRAVRKEDNTTAVVCIEDITQQRIADEARNSFVAHATHELRTPLTNIRLYVETALDEGEDDPALRGKCLNVINTETARLERVVHDLLSTAEIEAGALQLKRDDVRMDEVFEQLKLDYDAQASEKNITIHFELPPKLPVIQGDRDKVILALHNLMGNALKYTQKEGEVSVQVDVVGDELVVDVTDSGIGIREEDQPRIFDKFYRAQDKRLNKITGSGLGLALAREVVRMHGGDITVQSELDKGSTFTLTLPSGAEAA
ncbi:MAG: cell wall metabolism sensor histidine kinase WalK [Phycisphaerae bacterium]|nr:cell wall metabolism sensor histidine kinase WalK [Phycisphaerae bacterium]